MNYTISLILLATLLATVIILLLARPSPQPALGPSPAQPEPVRGPTITIIAESITDANTGKPLKADVYINGALIYQGVTQFQVTVPMDGSSKIRVTAPGYNPWGLRPRGKGPNQKLIGPIQLKPEE